MVHYTDTAISRDKSFLKKLQSTGMRKIGDFPLNNLVIWSLSSNHLVNDSTAQWCLFVMEIVASFNYSNGRRFLSAKRKEYTLYTNAFKINLYVAHIPMLEDLKWCKGLT